MMPQAYLFRIQASTMQFVIQSRECRSIRSRSLIWEAFAWQSRQEGRVLIYAVRKAGTFVITLVLVSILTFGVFQILPGDPVDIILGVEADQMQAAALTKELGLDKPIMERYFDWVFGAVRGDLGNSIRYQVPVGDLLKSSLPVTASLAVLSILLTILISVPAAVFLAKNHRKNSAMVLSSVTQFGIAVPSFWIGILLIMLCAVQFHILPSGDYTPFSENPI